MIKELERVKGGFSDAIVNTIEWKEYVVKRIKKGIPVFGYSCFRLFWSSRKRNIWSSL